MTNVSAVYPSGIFSWTDRVDGVSVDLAEDINAVAAEIIAVESAIGANPQIEASPPTGLAITYSSLNSRVSDAMNNANLPVSFLFNAGVTVPPDIFGALNHYVVSYDPYNMYNGTDLTIPVSGWWIISSEQTWTWTDNGYARQFMTLNGITNVLDEDLIDWQFSGNVSPPSRGGNQPASTSVPRWQQFGKRARLTSTFFQGPLHSNDRISIYSENGTSNPAYAVNGLTLKATCTKKITGTFTSG